MALISKEYVEKELERYRFPGMAIGVIRDGEVLMSEGFGYRDLAEKSLIDGDTQFGIASCTKSFTSALLGMLEDDGILSLDRPVSEYLPDFKMNDPVATRYCSLKDMLSHRTGLGGYDALWVDANTKSREELWQRLQYLKPNEQFRGKVQYSNLMYSIAAHAAEKLTGKSWDEMVRERIFRPLHMDRTNTSIRDMVPDPNHASPYWQSDDGPVAIDNWNVDLGAPCGGINSTVNDMLKWLQFHMDGGVTPEGKRLIRKETLDRLHRSCVPYTLWAWDFPENALNAGYGMGWYSDVYRGHSVYWHIGEIEGYGAMQGFFPREKLGIVVFNNIQKPCVLPQLSCVYTIIDHALGLPETDWSERLWAQRNNYGNMLEDWRCDLMETEQDDSIPLSHDPKAYTGEYFEPGHGKLQIVREGDGFRCLYRGVREQMIHWHGDTFKIPELKQDTLLYDCPLSFVTDAETGEICGLDLRLYGQVPPIRFERT